VKSRVETAAEVGILAEEPAEELERQGPDRLVRVRDAEEERLLLPFADRQELDRPPLLRGADRLQADESGMVVRERARARGQLLEGQELAEVGDRG
jgi:hypothetical protein